MRRQIANGLLALAAVGGLGWSVYEGMRWGPGIQVSEDYARTLVTIVVPIALSFFVVGYALSFDGRRARRPWALVIAAVAGTAAVIGLVWRIAWTAYGFGMEDVARPDSIAFGMVSACFAALVVLPLLFEAINRMVWSGLSEMFDRKEMPSAALACNRAMLLFSPGRPAMLRSVALARFRQGARGEVVDTLRSLHQEDPQDVDTLAALCKAAHEENDATASLTYLRALHALQPGEPEIEETLLEELIAQRLFAEALVIMERSGVAKTEEALDRYATVLLAEGRVDRATQVARELGEKEGIPFRRSQKLLREVLARMSEYVPAINILAAQAERMASREQRLRWLEKSIAADPHQGEVREALMEIYRDNGNTSKLESLLEHAAAESPRNAALQLEFIRVLHSNAKANRALDLLTQLNERADAPAAAALLESQLRFELQEYEDARKSAELGLTRSPSEQEERRLQAMIVRIEKQVLTEEVAILVEQAHNAPDDLPLQLSALNRLLEGGHVEKALSIADPLVARHPKVRLDVIGLLRNAAEKPDVPYPLLNLLCDLQAAAGLYDDALATAQTMSARAMDKLAALRDGTQKILRRSPHHLATLRALGDAALTHGKFTEMIHSYSLYLAHGGDETEQVDRALAKAYISLKDYENGRRFANQLLINNPADVELLKQMIPLALHALAPEDAAEYLKKLEIADPRVPELRKLKEKVQEGLGQRRFAFLQRELEAGKGGPETLEQLGDIARDLESYNDAITYYQRASRDREDAHRARRALAKLAFCYMRKRLDDLATDTLKDITLTLDDDPAETAKIMDILYDIGVMFLEAKHYTKAERVFKQLCKIDAGYRDVLSRMESLRV